MVDIEHVAVARTPRELASILRAGGPNRWYRFNEEEHEMMLLALEATPRGQTGECNLGGVAGLALPTIYEMKVDEGSPPRHFYAQCDEGLNRPPPEETHGA